MINIYRFHRLYFLVSAMILIPGMISLTLFGLKPSIDFVGGTMMEIRSSTQSIPDTQRLEEIWSDLFDISSIQPSGQNQVIIKTSYIDNQQKDQALMKLATEMNDESGIEVLRFESIGPTLSRELFFKTIVAVILVSLVITLYIWKQFSDWQSGLVAVFAMFHDILVVIGVFSLLGHWWGVEVDVLFVTAVLTTLSLSVHDTVVLFDRIRELKPKYAGKPFVELVNMATLQTLARSLNNSITIILMLLTLFLLGGQTIRWFSFALLIGAIIGTYSSPFVSVPLLIEWKQWRKKL